ncbi:signal transduction histidine kinase [Desulfobaculum xiamenense]|uniref:histidine kinase n=1 Tax=Desulfobaculum xiamenense TaxID=995050 RepID=A0A846QN28_9BACT|nr:ATP-binding protein [Desulfobaculum xiamenense]NJB68420.1 signal transduction histidine kinase [Desulfobaculum xiamenense]
MEFGLRSSKDSNPLLIAALALVVLGLGISYVTWHNLRQQRETINEHMFLSSRVILRGIETSLMREMRGMGRRGRPMGPMGGPGHPIGPGTSRQQVVEMLSDLVEQSEVEFLSLYAQNGTLILTVSEQGLVYPEIPEQGWDALHATGEWQALYSSNRSNIFVAALQSRRTLGMLCEQDSGFECAPGGAGIPYLVVGLDATRHLKQFAKFRSTAMYQTLYVLLVALFLWGLALAYMRRRDQGRRLHRLERFHSRLLDTMPEGLVTLDADGMILSTNPAAEIILQDEGHPRIVGRHWADLPLRSATGSDIPARDRCGSARTWIQYDYAGRSLEVLCLPIPASEKDEGEPGDRLVLVRDRTEIKALEDDLAEVRQLAAIGRLAAGLAHEIRNPLSALRGFAQFFADKLKGKSPEEQYAETMVREADRLNKVVSDLLFLSRPRIPERREVDMPILTADIGNLLARDFELKGAVFGSDLSDVVVHADPDMLKQALLNLVINSLNAIDRSADGEEPGRVEVATFEEQGAVCVAVRDNGHGMGEEERRHALEPFFTSRREGTGLGLAIVHGIMRAHGGQVSIVSSTEGPGHGTEVRLSFPVWVQDDSTDGVDSDA